MNEQQRSGAASEFASPEAYEKHLQKSYGHLAAPGWDVHRIALVRRSCCPKGIDDSAFELFVRQCIRSGMSPEVRECFCISRRENFGTREKPNWGTKYEFQASESGFLTRAERMADYRGIQASAVYAEDEIIVDQGGGTVTHRFNPAKRKGSLVGAWARVVRAEKIPVLVWLDFAGYVQQSPLWSKIPTTMIEKCARVAALRKAYPEQFGGLYTSDELPPELAGEPAPASDAKPAAARPESCRHEFGIMLGYPHLRQCAKCDATRPAEPAERAAAEARNHAEQQAQLASGASPVVRPEPVPGDETLTMAGAKPEPEPERLTMAGGAAKAKAGTSHETAAVAAKVAEQRKAAAGTMAETVGVVVAFGPHKGRTARELSDEELSETIELAHEKLMEQPKAKWAKAMRDNLLGLEAETHRRFRISSGDVTPARREPGEEG